MLKNFTQGLGTKKTSRRGAEAQGCCTIYYINKFYIFVLRKYMLYKENLSDENSAPLRLCVRSFGEKSSLVINLQEAA